MNKTARMLIVSGLIGISGLLVASKFTGDKAIEDAKSYIKESYSLLERYDIKQKGLKEEIKILEAELSDANLNNEQLSTQLSELTTQLETIEIEKEELLNRISELEEQIKNGDSNSESLKVELEKANIEIERANTKAKELSDLLKEKDLSKFNPDYEIETQQKEVILNYEEFCNGVPNVSIKDGYVSHFSRFNTAFQVNLEDFNAPFELTATFEDGYSTSFAKNPYHTNGWNTGFEYEQHGLMKRINLKVRDFDKDTTKIITYNLSWEK